MCGFATRSTGHVILNGFPVEDDESSGNEPVRYGGYGRIADQPLQTANKPPLTARMQPAIQALRIGTCGEQAGILIRLLLEHPGNPGIGFANRQVAAVVTE